MKKLYTILALTALAFQSQAQTTFTFKTPDTIVVAAPQALGDIECHDNYIINKTASPLTIDVVRVQNVGGTWTSAFCLDVCYADFVDSVQYTIPANDSTPFIPHFYIDATPDSQCIYMKVKKFDNPAEVAYNWFCGVTKVGAGIHESAANLADVSIYPSPVVAGTSINMNITNVKSNSKQMTLVVYNIYGDLVSEINNLREGNNSLTLDLAVGMYSYSLITADQTLRNGKISVIK